MFPFLYRNGLGSKRDKLQLFFHNSYESALSQHPSLWSFLWPVTFICEIITHNKLVTIGWLKTNRNLSESNMPLGTLWYRIIILMGFPIEFLVWDNLLTIPIALMRGGVEWGWHLGKLFLSSLAIVQHLSVISYLFIHIIWCVLFWELCFIVFFSNHWLPLFNFIPPPTPFKNHS